MLEQKINNGQLVVLLKDFFDFLKKKALIIIIFTILGVLLGFFYAFFKKPSYEAKLVFILNDSKSVNMGNLTSLVGQLGIGGQTGLNVSEDRVFYLANTKRIIGGALLKKNSQGQTLGDKLILLRKLKLGWEKDTILNHFNYFKASKVEDLTMAENKAMDQLIQIILSSKKYVVDSYKKKVASLVGSQNSGIMYVSFEFSDEDFAKDFVKGIYGELSNFYSISAIKSLQNNYDLISNREDSLKRELQVVEDQVATTIDNNFQVNKFVGKIGENRLRRKLEILNLFYAEVIKNKEIAKFNLDQERPVFQVVDEPMLPLEAKFKSKIVYSLLGGFGFMLICISFLISTFLLKNWNSSK